MNNKIKNLWIFACFSFYGAFFCAAQENTNLSDAAMFSVAPEIIQISSFYHGSDIDIDIVCPANYNVVLKIVGENEISTLNKKGRIGLLWMNVGEVIIKNVPSVYQLFTSENLPDLTSNENLSEFGIGYGSLTNLLKLEGDQNDHDMIVQEFIKLKEKSGLYIIKNRSLQPKISDENINRYTLQIPISSFVPVGEYSAELICFDQGEMVKKITKKIKIEKVGLVAFVATLALEHGALYGIIAILVAIIVGFFIGILFSYLKKRK